MLKHPQFYLIDLEHLPEKMIGKYSQKEKNYTSKLQCSK